MRVSNRWLNKYFDREVSFSELEERLDNLGFRILSREEIKSDVIWEIDTPLNRPDTLGHIGLARELAVALGRTLKISPLPLGEGEDNIKDMLDVQVWEEDLCPRYCGMAVLGITVEPSPLWLQDSIRAMGMSPENHVVDTANYVLFSTGHPVQVYDLDKLEGRKIKVRKGAAGESLTDLNGVSYSLSPEYLVIADEGKPLSIAGFMVERGVAVTAGTRNVLIECGCFDPVWVRKTEKLMELRTESSLRFGRNTDLLFPPQAAKMTAAFLAQMGGRSVRGMLDFFPKKRKARTVILRQHRINEILSVEVDEKSVREILLGLGYEIDPQQPGIWRVRIPSFRGAVEREADLIEDIARFTGYEKIPSKLPGYFPESGRKQDRNNVDGLIRDRLFHEGYDEVINNSVVPSENSIIFQNEMNPIELGNSNSKQKTSLRTTLLGEMLRNCASNLNYAAQGVHIFEIGEIFYRDEENVNEQQTLAVMTTGLAGEENWRKRPEATDFFRIKGTCEAVMNTLGHRSYSFQSQDFPYFIEREALSLLIKGEKIAVLGALRPEILASFGIQESVWAAEFDLTALLEKQPQAISYVPIKKYPCIIKEIILLTDQNVVYQEMKSRIDQLSIPYLEKFELFERISGTSLPDGKIGLAFRFIYCHPERTLQDDEVVEPQGKILKMLQSEFKIQLWEGGEN